MKKMNSIILILTSVIYLGTINKAHCQESVKIGDQEWMLLNLNVETFQNGDTIPEAKSKEEWGKADKNKQPAWCYYDNNPENGAKYGKLYNWYAVSDARGLAPSGWHIPSNEEWSQLIDFLGGGKIAGGELKNNEGWTITGDGSKKKNFLGRNVNGNGTNSSGFTGLPGGCLIPLAGWHGINYIGLWWCSKEHWTGYPMSFRLAFNETRVFLTQIDESLNFCSVRCIKD